MEKSKYKGVSFRDKKCGGFRSGWIARYKIPNGKEWYSVNQTEREAAIAYDTKMIKIGKEPVNILKRK